MRDIKVGSIYRHFKGNYYYIKDVAIHSEIGKEYVVYQALYDDYKAYIRPVDTIPIKEEPRIRCVVAPRNKNTYHPLMNVKLAIRG